MPRQYAELAAEAPRVADAFRDDLDAFEQRERQMLAEERQQRARELSARFGLIGLGVAPGH